MKRGSVSVCPQCKAAMGSMGMPRHRKMHKDQLEWEAAGARVIMQQEVVTRSVREGK